MLQPSRSVSTNTVQLPSRVAHHRLRDLRSWPKVAKASMVLVPFPAPPLKTVAVSATSVVHHCDLRIASTQGCPPVPAALRSHLDTAMRPAMPAAALVFLPVPRLSSCNRAAHLHLEVAAPHLEFLQHPTLASAHTASAAVASALRALPLAALPAFHPVAAVSRRSVATGRPSTSPSRPRQAKATT